MGKRIKPRMGTTIKPRTSSPLEYAYALAHDAASVPLTEEGRFKMMALNKELMGVMDDELSNFECSLMREKIGEAQRRFGY